MGAGGGALERGERRVDLECLGGVLGSLGADAVALEAANEGGVQVSAAADTLGVGVGLRVLELLERRVDFERLGEALRALGWDAVQAEAARKGRSQVSAAADSLGSGNGRRT